jgi:predicted nucleic acid-binding protein
MTTVFADSYYYLAMVSDRDEGHTKAMEFMTSYRGRLITTEWVLTEVGDGLSRRNDRAAFLEVLGIVQTDEQTTVVEATHQLFARGVEMFANRPDKDWSLTDCISFSVMNDDRIREALTGDHHFEQAGFVALLK